MNLILQKNEYKNLIVILLTLNKSEKVGYFVNNTVRPPLVTYPLLWSTCVTFRTPCHAIGHQLLPNHPFTVSATDLREHFLLSGVFYLTLLPAGFKASLGAGSSTSMLAGLHADL